MHEYFALGIFPFLMHIELIHDSWPRLTILDKNLQMEQDLPFQYRQWRWERTGQVLIACCIGAALLGLFGHHPLGSVTQQTTDGTFSIHYDRFARVGRADSLLMRLEPGAQGDGLASIWLDREYLDALTLTTVSPTPIRTEARKNGQAFIFQTDGNPFTATFSVQFQTAGTARGRIRADDGDALIVQHFVWP